MQRNKNPKVSVIVSAFNQERFIGRCLRSLLHQNFPQNDFEIIVVNDGSNDKTKYAIGLFIDPFDEKLKFIDNKINLGLPLSLNKAIKKSKGKYIVRVDSDDFVNSNFLSFLNLYLEMNNDADAVACDYLLIDDKENEIKRCNCSEEPIACGIMFKKEHLLKIGLYDKDFYYNEERELMIRFEKKFNLQRLNLPLYRYRRHEKNMSNNANVVKKFDAKLVSKHGKKVLLKK